MRELKHAPLTLQMTKRRAPLDAINNSIARYHELSANVKRTSSTSPMFKLCPCGVTAPLAELWDKASDPCCICGDEFDTDAPAEVR